MKPANERDAAQRQHEHRHADAEERIAEAEPGVVGDLLVRLAAPADGDDDGEGAERHHRVDQQRNSTAAPPCFAAGDHADQQVAGVGDARVGEHALDVALHQCGEVADGHAQHREHPDDPGPVDRQARRARARKTRAKAAKAAAFTPTAISAVTEVGAPS